MKKLFLITFFAVVMGIAILPMPRALAFLTPHPLITYEKGLNQLKAYQGDDRQLRAAQDLFEQMMDKHPDWPFGYLGMSQAKILEAYRYENHYNMKIITDEALPMAMKAMHAGPTLNMVHENYDRFEKIINDNDENQEHARRLLFLFPEKAETYLTLGNYFSDQGDFIKAQEYYKIVLRQSPSEALQLKVVQRIAWIYLKEMHDPASAVEYYQSALKIREDLPTVRDYLSQAYFELKKYDLCIENLQKAMKIFDNPTLRSRLWEAQGFLAEDHGKVEAAIDALQKATMENNQNTSLHYHLGNLYYKKQDFENAYRQFHLVIEAGGSNPDALYFAGRSAHSLGQDAEARDYYSQYLELKSDGQEAEWIRQNIPDLSHR